MCSFHFSTKQPHNVHHINRYLKLRGPDYTNVYYHGHHTYIHNLLSITGSFTPQPITSSSGDISVLFNGEIYNYKDFGNYDNDTKILIPLYEKYGIDMVDHLDGEFAICLVDYKNDIILVSTDIFSTKPLWVSIFDNNFYASTYESSILSMHVDKKSIYKVPANTIKKYKLSTLELLEERQIYKFSIDQHKQDFNGWNAAFSKSIYKRAKLNVKEPIFIGLSSGYDSGAISCELNKQNIKYYAYSVIGTENENILLERFKLLHKNNIKVQTIPKHPYNMANAKIYIDRNVEEFYYKTWTLRSSYNEYDLKLQNDNGAVGLSLVCAFAKHNKNKIFLSGQGADEIFSDYGFNGSSKYMHSNFGGLFPENLSTIFPWPSFFGSSMISYIAKEEYVGGSYGMEVRYPFLDKDVVQEFLWLTHTLKNKEYKSVLDNYLKINKYPYNKGEKIGF